MTSIVRIGNETEHVQFYMIHVRKRKNAKIFSLDFIISHYITSAMPLLISSSYSRAANKPICGVTVVV